MVQTNLVIADCKQDLETCRIDCKKVIEAAKAALKAKDDQISAQTNAITDLTNNLRDIQSRADSSDLALHAWYHNPVILTTIGVIVGGVGGIYLINTKP